MASFRGKKKKKAWATPRSVSFRGLIQNFRRASPPFSYASAPAPPGFGDPICFILLIRVYDLPLKLQGQITSWSLTGLKWLTGLYFNHGLL